MYCVSGILCTGSGKTTLLSQLSLDFAQQGKPVLWGSFEVKVARLMGKMLQQYHKTASLGSLSADKVQAVANDFEALPIRFLNFHGSTHIDKVSFLHRRYRVIIDVQFIKRLTVSFILVMYHSVSIRTILCMYIMCIMYIMYNVYNVYS